VILTVSLFGSGVYAQQTQSDSKPRLNIVDTAGAAGSFNTLLAALQATNLVPVLADENASFTVFAPTDEAFAALGQETIDALLADPETLSDILLYHVIADQVVDAETAVSLAGSAVTAANGDDLAIQVQDHTLFINDSAVVATDILATNGIIHVIDAVLVPPTEEPDPALNIVETALEAGSFQTLASLLVATGLDAVLADESTLFTVFAPTDDAFAKLSAETLTALQSDPELLKSVLLYHVLAGQAVDATTAIGLNGQSVETANDQNVEIALRDQALFINDSQVIIADVRASNGIIHAIDSVLMPPATPAEPAPTLAQIVSGDSNFRILNYALHVTGLTRTLDDASGTFTVFAPTDRAFYRLGYRNLIWLFRNRDVLRSVLLYHVLPDIRVDAATAFTLDTAAVTTANGQDLTVNVRGEKLFINRSKVIAADIEASNGIAHVLNRVLIPRLH
jgi:uncharacterized surface protein with fasciclin (FAS1) repeats